MEGKNVDTIPVFPRVQTGSSDVLGLPGQYQVWINQLQIVRMFNEIRHTIVMNQEPGELFEQPYKVTKLTHWLNNIAITHYSFQCTNKFSTNDKDLQICGWFLLKFL